MPIKISFVLPCYNVERYIADCLDSIFQIELDEHEYEVICINDCSNDKTRSIILGFVEKHPNLILIDHAINLTAGGARNTGLKAASGKYVWFVDPDDCIIPDFLPHALELVIKYDLDILLFNNIVIDESLNFQYNEAVFRDSGVYTGQEFIEVFFSNCISQLCIVWRCMFKHRFLISNDISFPIMRKSQDTAFMWNAIINAIRVKSTDSMGYSYRRNPYSVANLKTKANVLFSERLLLGKEIVSILQNGSILLKDSIRIDLMNVLKWCCNSSFECLKVMPKEELLAYYDLIATNPNVINQLRLCMSRKTRIIYSLIGGRNFWLQKITIMKRFC